MKTFSAKQEDVIKKWYLVDAEDKTVGRLSSHIASVLRGKHKPIFTPHVDTGDHVVVVNAEKVRMTGKKWDYKRYYRHSGYSGGIRSLVASQLLKLKPEEIIRHAVWGMLPHNHLGRKMMKKLRVYTGSEHPHQAQKPEPMDIEA